MVETKQTVQTGITYADWLKMPRATQPHEILDGELIMAPAPSSTHQWLLGRIHFHLFQYSVATGTGMVLASPIDVIIRKEPRLRTRQPDLLYLNAERTGVHGPDDLEEMPAIEIAPDLVVEMLSPKERRRTLTGKLEDYAALGALEAWLVSRESETVEVLRLQSGAYARTGLYGRGDVVSSSVLPDLNLAVDDIFA